MIQYKASDCYIHKTIVDDDYLFPVGKIALKRNGIIFLNETAFFLWNELSEKKTKDELCSALAGQYDTEVKSVEEDVIAFIESLLAVDALEEYNKNT